MAEQKQRGTVAATRERRDIDTFLGQLSAASAIRAAGLRGRLLFALDATASRERTWDRACQIQGEMFAETGALGGLDVQMACYRGSGPGFGEFRVTPWVSDSPSLIAEMTAVTCLAGKTQIARVLRHALEESRASRVNAVVFVGDCMEENVDELGTLAGELRLRGVPVFVFQEGYDAGAEQAFRHIARLSRGAWCRFDAASAGQLRDLLSAVAVYAAGGRKALADFGARRHGDALLLARQLK